MAGFFWAYRSVLPKILKYIINFFTILKIHMDIKFQTLLKLQNLIKAKSLKKQPEDQNMQHLCCLRHLLVSLKNTKFSEQVSNILFAVSNADYIMFKKKYKIKIVYPNFQKVIKKNQKVKLLFTFSKHPK